MQVNHNWKMERKTLWTHQDDKNKEILLFSFIVLEARGQLENDYLAFDEKHPSWGFGYILAVQAVASAAHVAMPTSLGSCGGGMPPDRGDTYVGYFISPVFVLLQIWKNMESYTSGSCRGHSFCPAFSISFTPTPWAMELFLKAPRNVQITPW